MAVVERLRQGGVPFAVRSGPRELIEGYGIGSEGNRKVTGEPIRLSDGRFNNFLFEPKQSLD